MDKLSLTKEKRRAEPSKPLTPNVTLFETPSDTEEDKKKRINRINAILERPDIQELLKKQMSLYSSTVDDLIETIFKLQSKEARDEVIKEFNAKLNAFNITKINEISEKYQHTVLYTACRAGCTEIVARLLNVSGIKTMGEQLVRPGSTSTCLHGANWGGHYQVCAQLLLSGCQPEMNSWDVFPQNESNDNLTSLQAERLATVWRHFEANDLGLLQDFLPKSKDGTGFRFAQLGNPGASHKSEISKEGKAIFLSPPNPGKQTKTTPKVDEGLYSSMNVSAGLKKNAEGKTAVPNDDSLYSCVNVSPKEEEEASFSDEDEPKTTPVLLNEFRETPADLNHRFQEVTEKLRNVDSVNEAEEKLRELNVEFIKVSRDFLHVAKTIGKVIISEVYLPLEKKTIKPAHGLGGVIGGEKYIVQQVLFKFAVGRPEMNVSLQVAAKIAGHELKSLSHVFHCLIPGLSLPLQCLIDYLGFRMIAMILLPINSSTLKVGSDDAGRTYHSDHPGLIQKFKDLGEALNLAPHELCGQTIYGPFDLEGHLGTDEREYIIDFSRLFPPVPPCSNHPNGFLYRLFRPEFVSHYKVPLCSDGFIKAVPSSFNNELVKAEKYLIDNCIPEFSVFFDKIVAVAQKRKMIQPGHFTFNISRTLHEKGINVRYIGKVYKHCKELDSKKLLLIEMAARVIKQSVREKIRDRMSELKFSLETPYIELVVNYLNGLLFEENNDENWKRLEYNIKSYFEMKKDVKHFLQEELGKPLAIKNLIWQYPNGRLLLFDRTKTMLGFKINRTYLKRLYEGRADQLKLLAMTGIGLKMKHMNVISHAEGWVIKRDDPEEALHKFERARNSIPLNKYTIRNYAQVSSYLDSKHSEGVPLSPKLSTASVPALPEDRSSYVKYHKYLFSLALDVDPTDTHTLYQYGKFLLQAEQFVTAEEYLIQSIEAEYWHKEAWVDLIKCFGEQKDRYKEFERFAPIVQALFY